MKRWIATALVLLLGSAATRAIAQQPASAPGASAVRTLPRARVGMPVTADIAQLSAASSTADLSGPHGALELAAACPREHCDVGCGYCGFPAGRVWFSAEYLLWWTKGDRLPPLLTTSPPGTALEDAGVLGRPGTTVLFGDERVNDGARSGARFTLGAWLNDSNTTGVEGNVFFLGRETEDFFIASTGTPILARPFFDVRNGVNNSLKVAYPNFVAGDFRFRETSELWGADAYLRQNIYCSRCCRVDLLGGYRFASLNEDLGISETEISSDPTSPNFGFPFFINENFGTRNRFHGGEFGVIAEYARCRTFFRFVGKAALGANCRTATIDGATRVGGFAPETGGFLALPSNIGRHRSSEFSVIPEIGMTVGYQVTDRLKLTTGYSFLYWTNVARPGDQIDLAVNTSQPPLGSGLIGEARPAFSFRDSDFWAQGVSFGLEFRY